MMFLVYLSTFLLGKQYFKMRILFIDTVYPFLKEELEKHHNICDTAYEKSKLEIGYDGRFNNSKEKMDFKLSASDSSWEFSGINEFDSAIGWEPGLDFKVWLEKYSMPYMIRKRSR